MGITPKSNNNPTNFGVNFIVPKNLIDCVIYISLLGQHGGYTHLPFTKHVRADPRFGNIPILMHSSLSGNCNVEHGKNVGEFLKFC